jgi:hypothetical protein
MSDITLTGQQALTVQTIREIAEQFSTQWRLLLGGRGSGKTTALVALYKAAKEAGHHPIIVTPHAAYKQWMPDMGVFRPDIITMQTLPRQRGYKRTVFLVEDWETWREAKLHKDGTWTPSDHVNLIEEIQIHRPQLVMITESLRHAASGDCYLAKVQPRAIKQQKPHVHDENQKSCTSTCPPKVTTDYMLDIPFKPLRSETT